MGLKFSSANESEPLTVILWDNKILVTEADKKKQNKTKL